MSPTDTPRFDRRRLIFFSLLTGLTALIPVPFVDDLIKGRVLRRLVREIHAHRRTGAGKEDVRMLATGPRQTLGGCLRGCLTGVPVKVAFYIAKKLLRSVFRKLVYVLAIKDASDAVSVTFHQGWLIDHALGLGHLDAPGGAARIRTAVEQVTEEVDPRPVEAGVRSLFRGSKATLRRALRLLRRSAEASAEADDLDERTLREEEELLSDAVDDLEARLADAEGHLSRLAARYEAAHRDAPAADPAAPGL